MAGLMDILQGVQQGSQAANVMQQGMVPNGAQPMGSPQMNIPGIGELREEIAKLNSIMDAMYRAAGTDDVMHQAVSEIMSCTQKLQTVANKLQSHQKDMVMEAAGAGVGAPGVGAGQMQQQQQQQQMGY